ncbi:MAG: DUF3379 family protein [Woeseiaceae bacterium]|nr:DUF3379 family protein [Woeseiaceae bacterium]
MSNYTETMNCETFRQAVTADPADASAQLRSHEDRCSECRQYREAMQQFDARLRQALEIPVPSVKMPDLDSTDNVVPMRTRRMTTPIWLGLAASVALAGWLGLALMSPGEPRQSLAEEIIAHMEHEQDSRVVTNVAVPERTLARVVNSDVAELRPGIGLVTYARSCVINGNLVPHLVIQGEKGPVTLLLLPDESIDAAISLEGSTINGVIVPVGKGSIAIIGVREESIEDIGNRVIESVKWSA